MGNQDVFSVTAASTGTDGTKLAITGAGNNTIDSTGMTNVATYDMSGASGTNTLNVAGTLTTGDVVTGGTGADTLRMNNASTIANIAVTGVETLRLSTGGSTGTAIFSTGPSFTTVRIDGDNAEAGTQTLTTVGAVTSLQYKGDGLTANSGAQQVFNALAFNSSFAGTADTLAVTVDNGGVTAAAGFGVGTGAAVVTTANGVETMTIGVTDLSAAGTATFQGLTDNALTSLTVTSTGAVALGTVTATNALGNGTLTSLSTAGVAGAVASSVAFATDTLGTVAEN